MPVEKKKMPNTLGGSFGYPKPAPKPTSTKKSKGKKVNDVPEKE